MKSHTSPKESAEGLKPRDDIVILPADNKGRATVIVDRRDYDEKMNKMLDDEKTYKELDCDPI